MERKKQILENGTGKKDEYDSDTNKIFDGFGSGGM